MPDRVPSEKDTTNVGDHVQAESDAGRRTIQGDTFQIQQLEWIMMVSQTKLRCLCTYRAIAQAFLGNSCTPLAETCLPDGQVSHPAGTVGTRYEPVPYQSVTLRVHSVVVSELRQRIGHENTI